MEVVATRTEGLGNSTYLLHHEGTALLVDPQRDFHRFLEPATDHEIAFVVETHVHNDYVSGAVPAALATGADLILPAGTATEFSFRPAFHLEEVDAGPFQIRPIHTPGHTPEHVCYLVVVDDQPQALFSGGSLLVGAAGRTDLLGDEFADQLTRLQFESVRRLAELPDSTPLYPTHGEGSFCSAGGAGRHESTIGMERKSNPALLPSDQQSFVAQQLSNLQPYPRYYTRMAPINRKGPGPIETDPIPQLSVGELTSHPGPVIDMRPRALFAAGHIPGSIGVEYSNQFATWVGWLTEKDDPIALVMEPDGPIDQARIDLARVGIDNMTGAFTGIEGLAESDHPLRSFKTVDVEEFRAELDEAQILDVRAPNEREALAIPGSSYRYVPDLLDGAPDDLSRDQPVWVVCGSGYRSAIAAGLLERDGFTPVVLGRGGVNEVMDNG